MRIIRTTSAVSKTPPSVAAIGFFDGVHLGHKFLIEQVKEKASSTGIHSAIITFPEHPRKIMNSEYKPDLLTTLDEKLELLGKTGIDYCFLLDFTPELSQLPAWDFMKDILKQKYNVAELVIGHDHRFGHNRSEGFEDYQAFGKKLDINISLARAYIYSNDMTVSSSLIREMLLQSNVEKASDYLGYDYYLKGIIKGGYQIGRTIGFPTANLQIENPEKLIPARGVYAVMVDIYNKQYAGMLNIGIRPTIDNSRELSIEVHILNFHSDIYNSPIKVSFIKHIRNENKFSGKEELRIQLMKDAETVEILLNK